MLHVERHEVLLEAVEAGDLLGLGAEQGRVLCGRRHDSCTVAARKTLVCGEEGAAAGSVLVVLAVEAPRARRAILERVVLLLCQRALWDGHCGGGLGVLASVYLHCVGLARTLRWLLMELVRISRVAGTGVAVRGCRGERRQVRKASEAWRSSTR